MRNEGSEMIGIEELESTNLHRVRMLSLKQVPLVCKAVESDNSTLRA